MEDQQSANWSKIAAWVFGCWALMIPIGVTMVRSSVAELVQSDQAFQQQFTAYVLGMERRMVLVEERQLQLLKRLDSIDQPHNGFNK